MKRALKISLLITILFLMLGCGGKKKISIAAVSKTTDKSVVTEKEKEDVTIETKHFGDTLKGTVPLPKLSKEPVKLMVESGGQKLEFEVTDNSLTYKSTPKHIATTTIHSVKESDKKAVADVVQVQEVKTVKIEKPWRPPWWWYALGIVVLVGVWYCIKFNLNPFSTLIKFIVR